MSLFDPPASARRNRCVDCGAPVQWVPTENGTLLMLDVVPSSAGNVLVKPDPGGVALAVLMTSLRRGGEVVPPMAAMFTHHFRTCTKQKR
jgi:hypothetical protein